METMINLLTFGKGNAKLGKDVYTFSLPAGHTCPFADACLSKADRETGKLADGPNTKFRCFAASSEAQYRNVRESRWRNFDALMDASRAASDDHGRIQNMKNLILMSLPSKARKVRIHVSGDFFNVQYLRAWIDVALERPEVLFYAYTKSLSYWATYQNWIPSNLVLTASEGGRTDKLINTYRLRSAKVVFSTEEAEAAGLEIDHDDSHAMAQGGDFALLLHGTQPKGTEAARALSALKKAGHKGYSAKR